MDTWAIAVRRATAAAESTNFDDEVISWVLRRVGTRVPRGAVEHQLTTRRDAAFVRAYLENASGEPVVLWHVVPTTKRAKPKKGQHTLSSIRSALADNESPYAPTYGDVALVDVGSFEGMEHEIEPIIRTLADRGCMVFLPQPPKVRLSEAWLRDELGYKSAMRDSIVYRPIHPDIDF